MKKQQGILPFEATHPGVIIKDEIAARSELTQKELAKEMGLQPSFLNEIIKGKRSLTADIAILLEESLGIPADYWMRFQSQYEIDKARVKKKNIAKIKNIEIWGIIKDYVPVNYFRKLGYLKDELTEDIKTIKGIYGVDSIDALVAAFAKKKFFLFRKSEKLQINENNMFAWSTLAKYEARNQKTNTFNFDNLPALNRELNLIFYSNTEVLERVRKTLNTYGIKFILIPKLEKAPVDGYSFWSGNNPAIALSMRYKRLDNFAFTLLHEIGHIDLHLRNHREKEFLDLTKNKVIDQFEKEADIYAQEQVISRDVWKEILEQHLPLTDSKIVALGDSFKIHPSIILGRACFEMDYYAVRTGIERGIG